MVDWTAVSAFSATASAVAAWIGFVFGRRRSHESRTRGQYLDGIPIPICICDRDGRVSYCSLSFARYFGFGPDRIVGGNIEELFARAGDMLANEGALATARADWTAKFKRSVDNPGFTWHSLPHRFGFDPGREDYFAFSFHTHRRADDKDDVYFSVSHLRTSYAICSVHPDTKAWDLDVGLTYLEKGHPFEFSPNFEMIAGLFRALGDAGDYACVGSSAVRFHSHECKMISSVDIIVPTDKYVQHQFLDKLDTYLKDGWSQVDDNQSHKKHTANGVLRVYVTKSTPGLTLTLLRTIGRWSLDQTAIATSRLVTRAGIAVRFLSLEDSVVAYLWVAPEKERHSPHRNALREFIRGLLFDNGTLRQGKVERIAERVGLSSEQRTRAFLMLDKISSIHNDFLNRFPNLHPESFDGAWKQFRAHKSEETGDLLLACPPAQGEGDNISS